MALVYKFFKARNFYTHFFTFRAFVAHSEIVLIDANLEHEERSILEEYEGKLKVDGGVIPDPIALKTGWVGEENGISKWPSTFYNDIANYLKIYRPDFINRLDRKYKFGKACRYFADNFAREIYYHNISEKSKYCVLKCRVVPSQKMSPKPCHVWAAVVKDVDSDFPGGTIKTAYCICTAGLGVPVTVSRHFYFESDFLLLQVKLNFPKLVNSVSGMYHQVPKLILHHYQIRK